MSFEASSRTEGETVWIRFQGELDLSTSPEAVRVLTEAAEGPYQEVLVDLSGIRFMDSSGLRAVVTADSRAKQTGRGFSVLHGGCEAVARIFSITGVEERLKVL